MIDSIAPEIELLPRRKGAPAPEVGEHIRVRGEHEWLLKGPADNLDAAAAALSGIGERISDDVLLLDFGNAVGFFDVPGLGRIEVVSGKWNQSDFDSMLAELTDVAAGLPFAATNTAALPYDRSVAAQDDVLYHMFVYIRHALSDAPVGSERLLPALRHVLRDPYRRFERTRRDVAIDQVRSLDATSLVSIATGTGGFSRVSPHHVRTAADLYSLRGYLPVRVDERHIVSTADTPENRFVKAFLASMGGVIDKVREGSRGLGSSSFAARIARECDRLDTLLGLIVQHPLWREVGPMVHLPASSPVLQRRRGYRQVYRHFAQMRLATRIPLDPSLVRDLLEVKDIALLYEIWTYFIVANELTTLLGPSERAGGPHVDPWQVTVRWDIETAWPDGTRLLYNPRFSRAGGLQHSFSVPLRPDITLHIPHGPNAGLHLLDAKFKVDKLSEVMPNADQRDDEASVEADERTGTFKRGDLYKMHTYRDAITGANSVWILYPGTETRFFSVAGGVATSWRSLPTSLDGVGAIPLVPGTASRDALRAVLEHLVFGTPIPHSHQGSLTEKATALPGPTLASTIPSPCAQGEGLG
jgi:predicted component of viral defense system (DUF524 family)